VKQAVADGIVGRHASVLAVLTGSGLKDVRAALRAGGAPVDLPPDDEALEDHLRESPIERSP
jgi:threonine synthase